MLILSRKVKEAVIIGETIIVRIAQIDGDVVKLAINAPREISVHRHEVFNSIKASNREAVLKGGVPPLPKEALKMTQKSQNP